MTEARIFLFEQLVRRDFLKKYRRTFLGVAWSMLSPLLTFFVMRLVFTGFFGRNTPHYTIYLFAGNIVMEYFREATKSGMGCLLENASILSRVNVPKHFFLLSKNASSLLNFLLTLLVFLVFCVADGVPLSLRFLRLLYPIACLLALNIGVGMILSALLVFFRDIRYLYDIFLTLLTYLSAIFYRVDSFSPRVQRLFLLNPVYCIIKYFRVTVIDRQLPSPEYHLLIAGYAVLFVLAGHLIYRRFNHRFVYYF